MTERSRFWNGTATGDAVEAPYDAPTEFAAVLRSMVQADQFTARSLVFPRQLNELNPTTGAGVINVDSGRALVYGTWYENDASVAVAVPTPSSATRTDRIVLRKDWATQTVRLVRIAGVEGGTVPALTQVAGSTWEMSITSLTITTGGTITLLLDERNWGLNLVPPTCIVTHSVDQVVPSGGTWLSFNTTWYETDAGMHDVAVNNDRITILRSGLYEVGATVFWTATSTISYREIMIQKNAAPTTIARDTTDGQDSIASTNRIDGMPVSLAAGDYLRLRAAHAIGSDLNIFSFIDYTPRFWVRLLQQHSGVGW